MSGAAESGAFGNAGAGPWGPGAGGQPGWQPGGGGPWSPWPGNAYGWWCLSRPLLIAATIIGFMLWWPVGVVMLAIAICNKKMGRMAFGYGGGFAGPWRMSQPGGNGAGWTPPWARWKGCGAPNGNRSGPSSGNRAFDEYREQTLKRLEDEQREFGAFLERLRFARDKAEFDQFIAERRQPPVPDPEPPRPEN